MSIHVSLVLNFRPKREILKIAQVGCIEHLAGRPTQINLKEGRHNIPRIRDRDPSQALFNWNYTAKVNQMIHIHTSLPKLMEQSEFFTKGSHTNILYLIKTQKKRDTWCNGISNKTE